MLDHLLKLQRCVMLLCNLITRCRYQELLRDKPAGTERLNNALQAGEAIYPDTGAEARETIRADLRRLRSAFDDLFEDVMTSQRYREVNLVQWTSFEDSYEQVEAWLNRLEVQLGKDLPLLATAEEKKAQLLTYKVCPLCLSSPAKCVPLLTPTSHSIALMTYTLTHF